jgi:N-acetylmuramoyl-L-alanine amidase
MPHPYQAGGRTLLLCVSACVLMLVLSAPGFAAHAPLSPYEKAQRLHEALEGRPEQQRTRRDYERVLNAYRAVYHGDPASPKADASISAVADLLAEQGRVFQDEKSLHDAIGQYEFLRRQYPASRFRYSALLTEGEIYLHDLNDRDSAKQTFQQFLKLYLKNTLADEARQELSNIHKQEIAERRGKHTVTQTKSTPEAKPSAHPAKTAETNSVSAVKTVEAPRQQQSAFVEAAHAQEPPEGPKLSDAAMNAPPPPPRKGRLPLVTGIRHWSTPVYTRVAIDLQDEAQYEASRVPNPDRIFFDLHGTRLAPELVGKSVDVTDDGFLKRVRAAQFSNDVTRIVLDVSDVSEYSAFLLPNPWRLIIDVHGKKPGTPPQQQVASAQSQPSPQPRQETRPATPPAANQKKPVAPQMAQATPAQEQSASAPTPNNTGTQNSSLKDIAQLDRQPNRVKATRHPTTAPVVQTVAGTKPEEQPNELEALNNTPPPVPAPAQKKSSKSTRVVDADPPPVHEATPTATGERSMVRALGLKIGRIVVDAGHGGHDSGTLGPGGIEEKDIVLDVALRLGKLLKQRLGADVIYTRDDDTFIPLETRTAIANKAQADLFISIHANSSSDSSARGVETYYLNFTTSADALEVAARENAVSDQSIHQLSDLVKKIALQDKISESREFASDVQQSLYSGLENGNPGLKDRGVKKAPFVVLIGANMPSILAEISFLTNPEDARELRDPDYRQRIAESLYRGVSRYVGSLSGVRIAQNSGRSSGK